MRYLFFAAAAFLVPVSAGAASLSMAPQSIEVTSGASFTVAVMAQPASSTIYSVRAHIVYDPALVQETWFQFAPNWLVVEEPGYSSVDAARGSLIKTAGYPGGITRPTELGVITFTARASGRLTILAAGDTEVLDGESINQFSGSAGAAIVSIAGAAAAAAPGPASPAPTPLATPSLAAAVALSGATFPLGYLLVALLSFALGAGLVYWLARRLPRAPVS